MDIRGKRFLVIGGAGMIGSHTAEQMRKEDVGEIVIYDNFVRGTHENLNDALGDPRGKTYEVAKMPQSRSFSLPTHPCLKENTDLTGLRLAHTKRLL